MTSYVDQRSRAISWDFHCIFSSSVFPVAAEDCVYLRVGICSVFPDSVVKNIDTSIIFWYWNLDGLDDMTWLLRRHEILVLHRGNVRRRWDTHNGPERYRRYLPARQEQRDISSQRDFTSARSQAHPPSPTVDETFTGQKQCQGPRSPISISFVGFEHNVNLPQLLVLKIVSKINAFPNTILKSEIQWRWQHN